ncbi:class I SAM-dependent methyltransferase [candidate division KSB1 bacterium]
MGSRKQKEDFDRLAQEWDTNPERVRRARAVAKRIRRRLPLKKDMNVMDFGTGTGLLLFEFLPYVRTITAVDNSKNMLAVLREKAQRFGADNIETLLCDIELENLPIERFELVTSLMTLHHIRNIPDALHKLYIALRPGGYLALADLFTESGDYHSDAEVTHHFGFEPQALKKILEEFGGVNIEFEKVSTVTKKVQSGALKEFPIFLLTAQKP